jgi:hypothetical protein
MTGAHDLLACMAHSAYGLQDGAQGLPPLPAEPPIGGALWTVAIPALLLIGSFLGTYLLYRRFASEEER